MITKNKIFIFFIVISLLGIAACQHTLTTSNETDIRVEKLLSQMTLDEKVGQLVQYSSQWEMTGPVPETHIDLYEKIKSGGVGSMLNVSGVAAIRKAQEMAVNNSRLGIPLLFGYDVIHGYKTIFPIPLGEAASWEPELARLSSQIAAKEAAASGINWTFAPMIDLSRDARWGRVMEGSGEDPYLNSVFAFARVRGFQGNDLSSDSTLAACAKHLAAYGFAEAGRDYNTSDISENTLHNIILPPFKACVDAGVATFMTSFNDIGGIPCTASEYLQRDILKGQWGFEGFIVSDWNSVGELIAHGVATNRREAAALAIKAGLDMDMEGNCYSTSLADLVRSGKVDEKLIDDAVRRVLRLKFQLGLFDDPYRYCDTIREAERVNAPEYLPVARDIARRSFVLLKNENAILPLAKHGKRIAVIGELADDKDSPLGAWRGNATPNSAVSVLEGMKEGVKNTNIIRYGKGPDFVIGGAAGHLHVIINDTNTKGMDEAVQLAKNSDVVVMVMGENCFQTGEAKSSGDIRMKGLQEKLIKEVSRVNKNIVLVLMNGRPLDLSPIVDDVKAILVTWHPGTESGNAIADVLFGVYNPSGKLPITFPRAVGQLPIYYNHKNTGRPAIDSDMYVSNYQDISNYPLFPFGFGLSYTTFELSNLSLSSQILTGNTPLTATVTLTNRGDVYGEEVVQLYIRDMVASAARPVKELKGFQKAGLQPGESKQIVFQLTKDDLAFYTPNKIWETEPGTFILWIGNSSDKGLEAGFEWQN